MTARPSRAGLVGGAVYLAAGAAWLALASPPGGWRWLAWFVAVAAVEAFIPGAANQVSLARAHLAAPALAYALSGGGLGGLAVTVAIAGATDLVDGAAARRFGGPTQLGGGLDPVVDGIFFGATAVGLAAGGAYPAWLAAVVAGRYALPALAGAVLLALGRRPLLRHTFFGQASTSLIAVLLGWVALWRGLGFDSRRIVQAAEVVIPVFTALTFANLAFGLRRRQA